MERGYRLKKNRGSLLAGAFLLGLACFIFLAGTVFVTKAHSKHTNKLVWRDRLHRLAMEGYVRALAQITSDPSLNSFDVPRQEDANDWGVFSASATWVEDLPTPVDPDALPFHVAGSEDLDHTVYVVVYATLTTGKAIEPKHMRLHTYIRTSDAGRFYVAFKRRVEISQFINLPDADVYAKDLIIRHEGNSVIPRLGQIYYKRSATAKDYSLPSPYDPTALRDGEGPYDMFVSSEGAAFNQGYVNQLDSEPIFPSIGPGDLKFYRNLAGIDSADETETSYFSGDARFPEDIVDQKTDYASSWPANTIYPPHCNNLECSDVIGISDVDDRNAKLRNHVYFVDGDLEIKGRVYGQVIFVATGTITIVGDIVSDSHNYWPNTFDPDQNYDFPSIHYPGCGPSGTPCKEDREDNTGYEEASNSHQAVLITPSATGIRVLTEVGVYDSSIDAGLNFPPEYGGNPFTIEAFMIAPNGGSSITNPINDPTPKPELYIKGAFLFGDQASWSQAIVIPPGQSMQYMSTLKKRPPPYLPGFTQLLVWHEEFY